MTPKGNHMGLRILTIILLTALVAVTALAGDRDPTAKGLVRKNGKWVFKEVVLREKAEKARLAKLKADRKTARDLITIAALAPKELAVTAVRKLAALEKLPRTDGLLDRLGDNHAAVRRFAARELGSARERRALSGLLPLAEKDPVPSVRTEAREAIRRIDPSISLQSLCSTGGKTTSLPPASYFLSLDQRAFIQDFDVEVS
jgi:HEAT repeats